VIPGQPGPQSVPAALAAELAAASWEAPPALYLLGLDGDRCCLRVLPVPGPAWDRAPLDRVILTAARLGARAAAGSRARPALAFTGAAVRFTADLAAGDRASRVHAGPGRVVRRFLLAVCRDGTSWAAMQAPSRLRPRTVTYRPEGFQPSGPPTTPSAVSPAPRSAPKTPPASPDRPGAPPCLTPGRAPRCGGKPQTHGSARPPAGEPRCC